MNHSDMILRLLTDLKMEHQELKEQVKKLQVKLTSLEEKKPNTKTTVIKQRPIPEFPRSFREWRTANQKIKHYREP
ncbi:preprotein translocase [Bacillus thuringiensis]|uniref:preprotein translocase n=1 Tax=Bacillus thuringiensis TaxID=1428 RepID=UPI002DBDFE47|nr:preprotein translocase [Bacillus thuringiensis]MEC3159966.1 preprotein translocase [Bacillus thuringiensis]